MIWSLHSARPQPLRMLQWDIHKPGIYLQPGHSPPPWHSSTACRGRRATNLPIPMASSSLLAMLPTTAPSVRRSRSSSLWETWQVSIMLQPWQLSSPRRCGVVPSNTLPSRLFAGMFASVQEHVCMAGINIPLSMCRNAGLNVLTASVFSNREALLSMFCRPCGNT